MTMTKYDDFWYSSHDGLRLYARDYSNALNNNKNAKTILCMHGITRNSADFEDICNELADRYRLIVVDQRGRGLSDYDPTPTNYNPLVYVQDMFLLLEKLRLSSVILLGTSMGGTMAMIMAAMKPEKVQGIVINDIGPEIAKKGLDRLKGYIGKSTPVRNWEDAAKQTALNNSIAFPEANNQDWLKFAKRLYNEDEKGHPVIAYDPNIAVPLIEYTEENAETSVVPNLWPVYEQIIDKPILLIRGELSDIIDAECVLKMQQMKPDIEILEIPNVGHAPLLSEAKVEPHIVKFIECSIA